MSTDEDAPDWDGGVYPGPNARSTDPDTSQLGASERRERFAAQRTKLAAVFEAAHDAGEPPLIAFEAGDRSGLAKIDGCCYWKRVSELRQLGVIRRLATTRRSPETGAAQRELQWVPVAHRGDPAWADEIRRR